MLKWISTSLLFCVCGGAVVNLSLLYYCTFISCSSSSREFPTDLWRSAKNFSSYCGWPTTNHMWQLSCVGLQSAQESFPRCKFISEGRNIFWHLITREDMRRLDLISCKCVQPDWGKTQRMTNRRGTKLLYIYKSSQQLVCIGLTERIYCFGLTEL